MRFVLSVRSLLFALVLLAISAGSSAQVGVAVSIRIAPPELPVYEQPISPEEDAIWTPGYWAYGDDDYFWVPGTWVVAPEAGYLWTPGYWGWDNDSYQFHDGYWGTQVGFYGGIDYGYGYSGNGYEGGRWENGHFSYNQSVSNVNVAIDHNVYNTKIENSSTVNRVSFNGGTGGVAVRATSQQEAAAKEKHIAPVAAQTEHVQAARSNPELRSSANQGKPPIAATTKPGAFKESGAVAAKEGGAVHTAAPASAAAEKNTARPAAETAPAKTETVTPAAETARTTSESPRATTETAPTNAVTEPAKTEKTTPAAETTRPASTVHAKDLPPAEHLAAANSGNAKQDQKFQQQQQKLEQQQGKERQTLQTKQEQDHQRLPQTPANEPKQPKLEQQHQQQTEQLAQKHTQQQQQLQQHQQPASKATPKPAEKEKPAA